MNTNRRSTKEQQRRTNGQLLRVKIERIKRLRVKIKRFLLIDNYDSNWLPELLVAILSTSSKPEGQNTWTNSRDWQTRIIFPNALIPTDNST